MSTLHLVFTSAGLQACLDRRQVEDMIVLLGEAVAVTQAVEHCVRLHSDLHLYGVSAEGASVDYAQLVELVAQHEPIVSWND